MTSKSLRAAVLKHLPFEDLDSLESELARRGFNIETIEAAVAEFSASRLQEADLVVVLGGPIGVYDAEDYPFLTAELDALRQRLAARKPTLGICLGAQLMATALDARLYPGDRGPEIGWFPLLPAHETPVPEWFAPLLAPDLAVFHWHGDTFDLPDGACRLARTNRYENQAFAMGDCALGLQFHPEVTEIGLERLYVGHSQELRANHISIRQLREDVHAHAHTLEKAAAEFWRLWLDHIL